MSQAYFNPTDDHTHSAARKNRTRAEEYLHDPDKSRRLYEEAVKKANQGQDSQSVQTEPWARTKACFRLLKALAKREYPVVPWGSILLFAGAILYFISPIDLIVDWLPLAGYLDDVVVMVFLIRQIKHDIDTFIAWEENRNNPGQQIIDL